jgi:hypothetical protein
VEGSCEQCNEPSGSIKCWEVLEYYFIILLLFGVRLSPLGTAVTTGLLYRPQLIDGGDCGAVDGMKIGRGS